MTWFAPLGGDHSSVVSVLGGFHLSWNGSVQVGIPRASLRLVAFLAVRGGVIRRAAIAGTLWPDASETHAYSNLRSALARLERACRKTLQASKLDLSLTEGAAVDIRFAQRAGAQLCSAMSRKAYEGSSPVAGICMHVPWGAHAGC